jgi:putative ABC transport system substrate-binding protein
VRDLCRQLAFVIVELAIGVGAAAAVGHAQAPAKLPLIAILETGTAARPSAGIAIFKQALGELGWVEGRTVRFETRYTDWQPDRIAAMARELVALKPEVLYTHSDENTREAMRATTSIPIVVGAAADLVALGGVSSLARPGGNVTGVTHSQHELDRKRLEILREVLPAIAKIAYLFNPTAVPGTALRALDVSAGLLNVQLRRFEAEQPGQLEAVFTAIAKERSQAVLVQDSSMLARSSERVTGLALQHRLPAMSQIPRFAERGGLLQYGADVFELFRRSATHVDKILKGAKPSDLPIEQPTKVELIVNLKTAKVLGITISQQMLARADHVIE